MLFHTTEHELFENTRMSISLHLFVGALFNYFLTAVDFDACLLVKERVSNSTLQYY